MSLRTPRGVSFSTSLAAILAAVSLGAAVWLSLQPHRLGDLHRLVGWTSQWLHGANLYGPESDVDYPPWAIVILSPLSLLPADVLPPFWVAGNLAALLFIARRLTRDVATPGAVASGTLLCLLLAAGALRVLNQFSLVSLALALAGTSRASPWSPLWLGLSLLKPQIGGVLWVLAALQRRWRLVAVSCLVPLALTGVHALVAGVPVLSLPSGYAGAIARQYSDIPAGRTEITPWLLAFWPSLPGALAAGLVTVLTLLPLARPRGASTQSARTGLILSMASLFSLRHLSYDLILLLPWIASLRGAALWIAAGLLIAEPSTVLSLAGATGLAQHADRIALVGLWVWCVVRWGRHDAREARSEDAVGRTGAAG